MVLKHNPFLPLTIWAFFCPFNCPRAKERHKSCWRDRTKSRFPSTHHAAINSLSRFVMGNEWHWQAPRTLQYSDLAIGASFCSRLSYESTNRNGHLQQQLHKSTLRKLNVPFRCFISIIKNARKESWRPNRAEQIKWHHHRAQKCIHPSRQVAMANADKGDDCYATRESVASAPILVRFSLNAKVFRFRMIYCYYCYYTTSRCVHIL